MIHRLIYGSLMCERTNLDARLGAQSNLLFLDFFHETFAELVVYAGLHEDAVCRDAATSVSHTL